MLFFFFLVRASSKEERLNILPGPDDFNVLFSLVTLSKYMLDIESPHFILILVTLN